MSKWQTLLNKIECLGTFEGIVRITMPVNAKFSKNKSANPEVPKVFEDYQIRDNINKSILKHIF